MNSVCVQCGIEHRIKQNGFSVVEMFMDPPQPYRIWSADLWECPVCGAQTTVRAAKPRAEYSDEHFEAALDWVALQPHAVVFETVKHAQMFQGATLADVVKW